MAHQTKWNSSISKCTRKPNVNCQLQTQDCWPQNRISMEKMHQIYSINPIVVWMFNGQWPNSLPCLVWVQLPHEISVASLGCKPCGNGTHPWRTWGPDAGQNQARGKPGCLGITTIRLVVPLWRHTGSPNWILVLMAKTRWATRSATRGPHAWSGQKWTADSSATKLTHCQAAEWLPAPWRPIL